MRGSAVKCVASGFSFDSHGNLGLPSGTQMPRSVSVPVPRSGVGLRLLPVLLVCLLSASPVWAFPLHRSHSVRKQIEALEMEWRNAELQNNVNVMGRLLADDYLGISANGTVVTKSEEIAQHRAGTISIKSLDISDLKVRVYSGTAVVTSQAAVTGMNGQSNISGYYRYTRVYAKRLGKWKIVSFEASRIDDVDARKTKARIRRPRH